MKIEFARMAMQEYCHAYDYYESMQPELGWEFRDEVADALNKISEFPQAWTKLSIRTRRCLTNRFPYGILYQIKGNGILIVSVMHMHRNPEHWTDRI